MCRNSLETTRQPLLKKRGTAAGTSSGAFVIPMSAANEVTDVVAKLDGIVSMFVAGKYDDLRGKSLSAIKRETQ